MARASSYTFKTIRRNLFLSGFLLLSIFSLFSFRVYAQVAFTPTVLMINDDDPIQEIRLTNTSYDPQVVEVVKNFGYPIRDNSGKLKMVYEDSSSAHRYDLGDHLRIYPSKVIIPPRSRQVIRVQVLNRNHLKNQMYWTRLGIQSRAQRKDIGETDSEWNETSISYLIKQNMGVYYRHGRVKSELQMKDISYSARNHTLSLFASLQRTGNSPFLGIATIQLKNEAGKVIGLSEMVVNIFFDTVIPFTIKAEEILEGHYTIEIKFETTRNDIDDPEQIKAAPQIFTRELKIKP